MVICITGTEQMYIIRCKVTKFLLYAKDFPLIKCIFCAIKAQYHTKKSKEDCILYKVRNPLYFVYVCLRWYRRLMDNALSFKL